MFPKESIPAPETGRAEYRDDSTPGLILRVTPNGVKTFCLLRRVNGRPARVTIGRYPAVTVEQAQRRAQKLLNKITDGVDPRDSQRARRQEWTLAELFDHWMKHAKAHKKSWREDERMYDKFLSHWAGRKLSSIRHAEVQSLHIRLAEKSGQYQANRVHELIRAMYNEAKSKGYGGENPALGIRRFPEEKRDRFLHGDELKAFFVSLAQEPNETLRDFFCV